MPNIIAITISIVMFMFAVVIHEFAHGWVAYKLGDSTAKYSGRLTLNPVAHIDLYGTIIFPLLLAFMSQGRFIFGWAKPVPINYWGLRNPKKDIIWVGLAGPAANFLLAGILAILINLNFLPNILIVMFSMFAFYNLLLGVFNLIPIPPLDGSRILLGMLPYPLSEKYIRIEPYGFILLFAMMFLGLTNLIISPIVGLLASLLGLSF
jgi:Zn-dependent protease